jgi:hypothetical protein
LNSGDAAESIIDATTLERYSVPAKLRNEDE